MKTRSLLPILGCMLLVATVRTAAFAQSAPDFAALTLAAAESMLVARNRDIALARSVVEQARADVITAGQKPNPQFNLLTQNINRDRGIGAGGLRDKTVDSIVGLSQTIERGDKAELRVATARQLAVAAGADLTDAARTQLLSLRGAYFDLLAAQEKLASAGDAALLFGKTMEAANLRLRAGDLSGSDVARIGVDFIRAQNDARAAAADLARARLALAILIAAETDAAGIRAVSPWPIVESVRVPDDTDAIIARRPDVQAAMSRLIAAERARELAQSLRKRDVTLSVQFEHYPVNESNQSGSGNSLGVGVSVPLFLRHSYEGEIARARSDWYVARDFLERAKALAMAELLRARSDLDAARGRSTRIESELLPMARKSAEAAEFAFRNGAIGVMDLLDARRTQKAIQIDASVARAEFAKAFAVWQANVEIAPMLQQDSADKSLPLERKR